MNKSKLAALLLGGLALLWAAALFLGFPLIYGKRVEGLVGHPLATVRQQLGPPTREWDTANFACDPGFPCTLAKKGDGPVWLYSDGNQAWYLYFDAGKLAQLEAVRPGAEDAGPPEKLPLQ